jgi:hypothetical protein
MLFVTLNACGGGDAEMGATGGKAATLRTVVGDGGEQLGDGGPATSVGFCGTSDVALEVEGNMYIAGAGIYCSGPGGHAVRKIDPSGTITTVVGTRRPGFSGE